MAYNNREWMSEAACRDHPTALFYTDTAAARSAARAICSTCPVTRQCLEMALEYTGADARLDHGIWAGTTPYERSHIRWQRRQKGTPT